MTLEITHYFAFYWEAWRSRHPYVRSHRLALGVGLSLASIAFWIAVGRGDVVWKLMVLTAFTTAVPVSFRGAIEHHSEAGRSRLRQRVPRADPAVQPESPRASSRGAAAAVVPPAVADAASRSTGGTTSSIGFGVYVKKDLVLMHPMEKRPKPTNFPT